MTHSHDLHERLWQAFNSEVPITTEASGLIGQGERCAAWVDAVYLFSSFIVVRTCLIARLDRYADRDHRSVSLVDSGFDSDEPSDVVTTITIDEQALSTSDGTLQHSGAESSSGRSEATWWLPNLPVAQLTVAVVWPLGGLEGRLEFDTADWRDAARAVLSV